VLCINTRNEIQHAALVSRGSIQETLVHPIDVFKPLITTNSPGFILVHNHPSGDSAPSPQDVMVTKRMLEAGKLMGLRMLDHIIMGRDSYFSFADEGRLS
jgi:DNA repair protein RadC